MNKLLLLCYLLVVQMQLWAQGTAPLTIKITLNKTVSLKFPAAVLSADRGRSEVLLQRAKGTRDVLLLKAASAELPETNLTVVTADGGLYNFTIDYADEPELLQYVFERTDKLDQTMAVVAQLPAWLRCHCAQKYSASLSLDGIYVKNDMMFLSLTVGNASAIDYTVGSFQLSIVDRKQAKRTAQQEIVLPQKDTYGMSRVVEAGGSERWVIAVPKFTIPDKKYLSIQLLEEGGGRHLQLRIKGRTILKARALQ